MDPHDHAASTVNSSRDIAFVLGCGRLGSTLTPLDRRASVRFLQQAFDLGIRDFDTANIYGQGDSERFIGEAFADRRSQVRIGSKAGQQLPQLGGAMSIVKSAVKQLARHHAGLRAMVARKRAGAERYDFAADSVAASLEGSLQRLGTDHLDIFYLHSAPAAALGDEALMRRLQDLRQQGKFRSLGVSCDALDAVGPAMKHPAVDFVQFDLAACSGEQATGLLDIAAQKAIAVYLRGAVPRSAEAAASTAARLLEHGAVAGALVGTTDLGHLQSNLATFRRIAGSAA